MNAVGGNRGGLMEEIGTANKRILRISPQVFSYLSFILLLYFKKLYRFEDFSNSKSKLPLLNMIFCVSKELTCIFFLLSAYYIFHSKEIRYLISLYYIHFIILLKNSFYTQKNTFYLNSMQSFSFLSY